MAFINLTRKLKTTDNQSLKSKKHKRSLMRPLAVIIITFGLLFFALYLPSRGVYKSVREIVRSARSISAASQNENLDDIRKNLSQMRSSVAKLNQSLRYLVWLRIIPVFGGYYSDISHFAKAAEYELTAVQLITVSLDPYKNELGFTGVPTPGQDRVQQLVKILEKVIPQLEKIEPQLKQASQEVEGINVDKYPEKVGRYYLKSKVETVKNLITGVYIAVSQAKPAIEQAPLALGQPSAKNYLIIFQNDKELRPTGGFMTAYAFLKIDKGRVSSSASDDIYRLDEKLLKVCLNKICALTPPAPIVKYLPEVTGKPRSAWSMRDSNLSPDLPTSLKEFERMYSLMGEGVPFDGIIMIDTHVVEDLIKITGPIEVFGTTYSADTDKRCNCSNVIFELENYAQIIEKGEQDRKAILGTLMQQILARSLGASVQKLPEFINTGVKLANDKHIMFFMHDDKLQQSLGNLNWTGQIKKTDGDYLHINDSNFAGGKSNLYVEKEVIMEITAKPNESLNKLTITYKNPMPYSTWLNSINLDYVRIYVPKGSKLVSSKGSEDRVNTIEDELGKTVFDAFIKVRPQNSRVLSFEYTTPIRAGEDNYPLMIQKQPGVGDYIYTIKLNGKQKAQFKLFSDTELKL